MKKDLTFPLFSFALEKVLTLRLLRGKGQKWPKFFLNLTLIPNWNAQTLCVNQFFLTGSLDLKHSGDRLGCAESSCVHLRWYNHSKGEVLIYAHAVVCIFKILAGGEGPESLTLCQAETTAWHSVCALWPSDVPRSCNLGHSCFPFTFRHLSFAETNLLCVPNRKTWGIPGIYLELEGKCCLYRSIMLYRSVSISWLYPFLYWTLAWGHTVNGPTTQTDILFLF